MNTDLELSNAEFLKIFKKGGAPMCWILGSGASRQSGVRMGRRMTEEWLGQLYSEALAGGTPQPPLEEWANKEFGDIEGFEYRRAVNFYPYVYQRRFHAAPEKGLAFLEDEMKNAEVSFGYMVLAQIMASPDHRYNIAITTNFDDLLARALVLCAGRLPIDCGRESLASYASLNLARPIIAKLQRDLMIASERDPKELAKLDQQWEKPLEKVFRSHTPVIIGFGDSGASGGSLMRFLSNIPPLSSDPASPGIYWCYREKTGTAPAKEVLDLVSKHNGKLVPILGFDELMLELWDKMLLVPPNDELHSTYNDAVVNYQAQFTKLRDDIAAKDGAADNTEAALTTIHAAKEILRRLLEE